jgi:hypothetical protein
MLRERRTYINSCRAACGVYRAEIRQAVKTLAFGDRVRERQARIAFDYHPATA